MKKIINSLLAKFGLKITKLHEGSYGFPIELNSSFVDVISHVRKNELSMTSINSLQITALACEYVERNNINGDFVECGVWRGGNSLIAADIFQHYKNDRTVFMFDTFSGMTEPSENEEDLLGDDSPQEFFNNNRNGEVTNWCLSEIEEVRNSFLSYGIDQNKFRLIKGDVSDTLKDCKVENISILRLDTDWYESTKLELEVLWPKLSSGGIIIIDDYGKWSGSKKAVDEFFSSRLRPFFVPVDGAMRIGVKP